jgi:hypothetical protein
MAAGIALWVVGIQAGLVPHPLGPAARGDLALARSERSGLRVLFIGNSLTYYNEMPSMVRRLAAEDPGGRELLVVQYTAPGWRLTSASADQGLLKLLREIRWDDVVLQERSDESSPFFDALHARASAVGARTVIFDLGRGGTGGYRDQAGRLGAELAPVWDAWMTALARRPGLDLYAWDGHHPGRAGSFLIACVFYAVLTGRDPTGNGYTAGLEPADARFLQQVARDVVLH